ncbi:PREDICTED: uncharacterized protein LOC109583192 [Amphimedon queenslandica]|nr:PREDICTED: uncharacterized protein LOC109583192 [Amphimedon queenslandica]|eukprot:XP_019853995.1 PREDICTED: uncharacterized protein LOC109583192 [Amphimedon queenslandica]
MVNSLREGLQHVYFPDGNIFCDTRPSSLFITVMKKSKCGGCESPIKLSLIDHSEPSAKHFEEILESISEKPLSTVTIRYNDLPRIDHDPVSLFADPCTKASELLIGALAQLGSTIKAACPYLKDRDDEDELLRYFGFILCREEKGRLIKVQSLDPDELVLPLVERNSVLTIVLKGTECGSPFHCPPLHGSPVRSILKGISATLGNPNMLSVGRASRRSSQVEFPPKLHRPATIELSKTPQSTAAAARQELLVTAEMKLNVKSPSPSPSPFASVSFYPSVRKSACAIAEITRREIGGRRRVTVHSKPESVDYIFYKAFEEQAKKVPSQDTPQHGVQPGAVGGPPPPPRRHFQGLQRRDLNRSVSFASFSKGPEDSPAHPPVRRESKIKRQIKKFFQGKRSLRSARTQASIRIEKQVSDEGFQAFSEPSLGDQNEKEKGERGRRGTRRRREERFQEDKMDIVEVVPPALEPVEEGRHPSKRHSTGIMKGGGAKLLKTSSHPKLRHPPYLESSI